MRTNCIVGVGDGLDAVCDVRRLAGALSKALQHALWRASLPAAAAKHPTCMASVLAVGCSRLLDIRFGQHQAISRGETATVLPHLQKTDRPPIVSHAIMRRS